MTRLPAEKLHQISVVTTMYHMLVISYLDSINRTDNFQCTKQDIVGWISSLQSFISFLFHAGGDTISIAVMARLALGIFMVDLYSTHH